MDWLSQGVSPDAARAAAMVLGCDDDELEAVDNGQGGVVLKRRGVARRSPRPTRKESEPMSRDNDEVAEALTEVIERMSASDRRTLRKFLQAVTEEVDAVKKSASSDFLDELRRYFEEYLAELSRTPVQGSDPVGPETPDGQFSRPKTTNPHPSAPPDRPHTSKAAIRSLAKALMERLVRSRPDLMVVQQDDRGLVHNPARDAREEAARRDM